MRMVPWVFQHPLDSLALGGGDGVGWLGLGRQRCLSGHRLHFLAHAHNLPAVLGDRDQLLAHHLAVLAGQHLVLSRLQANFLRSCPRDDDFLPIDAHANTGVVHFHDQRAVGREQTNDRVSKMRHAGRLGQTQSREQRRNQGGRGEPAATARRSGRFDPGRRFWLRLPFRFGYPRQHTAQRLHPAMQLQLR